MDRELTLTGEFRPWQQVDLHAKIAGYLKTLTVDVGSRVAAGQLIGVLEAPELEAEIQEARASVMKAKSDEQRVSAEIRRAESMQEASSMAYRRLTSVNQKEPGLIAAQEIAESNARLRANEADVASAQANLNSARQATLAAESKVKRLEVMLLYTRIAAPFAGVVVKRYVDPGSMIQAGIASSSQAVPLIRLADLSKLRLAIILPETAISQVRVGSQLTIQIPALAENRTGSIARLAQIVSSNARSMEAEVDVSNGSGAISPGMIAEIRLKGAARKDVSTLPLQAVVRRGGQAYVLAVRRDQTLEERRVEIGNESASAVELLSGLAAEESVVIGNRSMLRPGQKVTLKQGGEK